MTEGTKSKVEVEAKARNTGEAAAANASEVASLLGGFPGTPAASTAAAGSAEEERGWCTCSSE